MKTLIILLLMTFVGCATRPIQVPDIEDNFPFVDNRVQEYVEQFDLYYRKLRNSSLDSSLVINYGIIKGSKKSGGVYNRILNTTQISSVNFEKLRYVLKQYIIFHELGHHVLRRHHDNTMLKNGCPKSIMHKKINNRECYIKHHSYYIKELFYGFSTVR